MGVCKRSAEDTEERAGDAPGSTEAVARFQSFMATLSVETVKRDIGEIYAPDAFLDDNANAADQGRTRQAIDVFQEVDPKAKDYTYAKFFEGISFVRMRKARPAIASFRAILDAIDSLDDAGSDA